MRHSRLRKGTYVHRCCGFPLTGYDRRKIVAMPSMFGLEVVSLTLALATTGVLSHPLFNGQLIERAEDLLPEYDYVVVGGGASGLTVANRLSEQSSMLAGSRSSFQ